MRIPRWTIIPAMSLLLWALAAKFSAQQTPQPPPAPPVIRINVNLVQVDAVVTDSKGKPVTDLKVDDFELLQDGKPQVITNFEFVDVRSNTVRIANRPTAPRGAPRGNAPPAPFTPQRTLRPQQIRRTMAMVVDDLGLSADSIYHVRDSLNKWVENEMQPGDLVAVIRTSAGMGSLQQFTGDKRLLRAAINLVKYHPGRVGVSSFAALTAPSPAGSIDTSNFNNEVARNYMVGSMGAIQYIIQGLRDVPGRKSLVLFSESMQLTGRGGRSQEAEERLRRLSDAANRSSVVIYSIDPRGVIYTGLTAEDAGGQSPRQLAQIGTQRTNQLLDSREGMQELARKTGGLFIGDNNDIPGSLRQVVDDGDGYYLLAYQPDATTFTRGVPGAPAIEKFHSITVRVKRPDLHVRSRSGFFSTPDRRTLPPQTRIAQITQALTAPFATGDLRVRLTSLFWHSDKQGAYVRSMLYFDANDLTFTTDADGFRTAEVDIAAVTFDEEGTQVEGSNKTWRFRLPQDALEKVLKQGFVYSLYLPVKKPGAYQLRVAMRDAGSQRMGSATQFIEVPDLKKGRLAISGIVLAADPSQVVESGTDGEPTDTSIDPNGTPAVRIFKQGSTVAYAYAVLNARTDKAKKPQLESQTRLFRDGEQIFATTPAPLNIEGQQDLQHLLGSGRLELIKLAAGDYVLQVIVTDKLASEKDRITAQSMDFEVR